MDELNDWDHDADTELQATKDTELRIPTFDEETTEELFEFETSERIYDESGNDNSAESIVIPEGFQDIIGDRGVLVKWKKRGEESGKKPSEEDPFVECRLNYVTR